MPRPDKNNRMLPRKPGNTIGPLRLKESADCFSADVHDISVVGIGLVGNAEYATGSIFTIESGPKGKKLLAGLAAELCHATPMDDGRWLLGCRLSRPLTVDDFEILG
jgi:hypothetical protein